MENLTVVIPFYEGHHTISRLLSTLPEGIPTIVVDDKSSLPLNSRYYLEEYDAKVIHLDKKGYFAGAVNTGIKSCQTDVLVLNQDIWFDNHAFFQLIESLRGKYAFFGERIRGTHPAFGELGYAHGTCLFIRRDAIEKVGLLNEKDYPLWGNTAEYQWRVARKGFQVFPLKEIAGMVHERSDKERYGSSIKKLLSKETERHHLLVRTPPLLSIIVPCHNYGRYLQDCINSLIGGPTVLGEMPGQTLQSFEIIIVDDASTDDSPEYIKKVVNISKGIRAYRLNKNVGTARTLNIGIEKAVGKYITFLSADDMREPFSLEKLVETCEQNPHSFAYDDVWLFHTHKKIKKWELEDYNFEKLIWKNQVHAGIVFPKEAWIDVGGYPEIMGDGREDWAFNVSLGIKGWCGIHVRQLGYLYRREGQNRTERNTTEEHRRNFLTKMMSLFPAIYKGERPVACCGKGSNKRSNNGTSSKTLVSTFSTGGSLRMATHVGSEGMVKIEYLGKQVSSTWTGDVTSAPYTFGVDRPKGWVDKRDVGTRESGKGFLSKKDRNGNYLFRLVEKQETTTEIASTDEEPLKVVEVVSEPEPVLVQEAAGTSLTTATMSIAESKPLIDPTDMNVEQIRQLDSQNLTLEQWKEIYKLEMANRNRKSAVTFLEEKIASLQE